MAPIPLPIDAQLGALVELLRARPAAVVRSPTGSGKTTRVPVALEAAGLGLVVLVEPRRVAARAAARRMAFERGEEVGASVGYHVRFDRKVSKATRVTVMTEGLFLRKLLADPFLEGVGCVVFDEFHERHLDGDLGLSLARAVQREAREDLKLVILSATIEPEPFERFLGAGMLDVPGSLHPVEVEHQDPIQREPLEEQVVRAVRRAREWTRGRGVGRDVLVFLPGKGEIARCERALSAKNIGPLVALHGELDAKQQDRALRPGAEPRVILSTNVAESSLTIDGLGAVVDSGLARVLRLDERVGFDRLELVRIARPSVEQRMGRAGRTGPGLNVRLWSRRDEHDFPAGIEPEIARVDVAGALLAVADFGEAEPAQFPWFEAPPASTAAAALSLLERLGALAGGHITERGRLLARLPLAPRFGDLLIEGAERGVLERAALAAAILSERDAFARPLAEMEPRRVHESDLLERVEMVEGVPGLARPPRWALAELERVAGQLVRTVRAELPDVPPGLRGPAADEALLRTLFAAFPDRVARVRPDGDRERPRALMVGGRGVVLADACRVREAELLLALELAPAPRGGREDRVTLASIVRREWLGELEEELVCELDAATGRLRARRVQRWGELVIEDKPATLPAEELEARRGEALAGFARERPERAFDLDAEAVVAMQARVEHARAQGVELGGFDPRAFVVAHAEALVAGIKTLGELAAVDLGRAFLDRLEYGVRQAFEREAPERVTLPCGDGARLVYDAERGPVLRARIQQLFGWQATPTIGSARVPLLLELCAPNGRPQQVTADLAGFWAGSYALVRKDLRGRYPKHPWPEDPAAAAPIEPRRRRR